MLANYKEENSHLPTSTYPRRGFFPMPTLLQRALSLGVFPTTTTNMDGRQSIFFE